ncbi:MAG: DUF4296 domain-containing protein [Bacteroidales bacterium]|nr:DUF4296 domain-containing protein [Bacteroidales bacterium]
MKNLFLILILMVLFGASCSPKKDVSEIEIPKNILPPDSMTLIISDIQATEAILREYKRIGQDNELRSAKFLKQTFEKNGITPDRYNQSVAFYEEHPELYHQIYTDVVSRLTLMQTKANPNPGE